MKRISLLVLICTFCILQAKAADSFSCYSKLTDRFKNDVSTFVLDLNNLEYRDYGNDFLAEGIYLIRVLLKDLGCFKKDINFGDGPTGRSKSRCQLLSPQRFQSRSCYIESNLGFFFISYDMMGHATIVFNRWD